MGCLRIGDSSDFKALIPNLSSDRAMHLIVNRLTDPAAIQEIAAEWEQLDALSVPRTPFSSPTWNALWWKHYRRQDSVAVDEFFVHAIRAPDGRLIAVAPLFIREYRLLRFVRFRFAQFFGADSSITELRGLVCAPDDQPACVAALAAFFRDQYRFWDLLRWDGLRASPNGERVHGLSEACDAGGQLPNYFIPLPSTWEEMLSRLNGKFKRNIRKRYELLAKDGFTFKFRVNENADSIGKSLHRFFDLHGLRAKSDEMDVKHPDRFTNDVNRAFIADYVNSLAGRGACRIFELEIDSRPIASILGFVMDDNLWLYSSGFDPSWRKYGIMTMLTAEILKWGIGSRMAVVNLSCGKDMGKIRWNPTEVNFFHVLQPAPRSKGRLLLRAYESVDGLRRVAAWRRGYRPGKGREVTA
jgi:CelD/BcsL family acetyltransferase involved in cellulose biosynthesis